MFPAYVTVWATRLITRFANPHMAPLQAFCYSSDTPDTQLLAGDWMLSRSLFIPHHPDRCRQAESGTKMWKLSELAARAVHRKRFLHMWDVSELLQELQDGCKTRRSKAQPDQWLRRRLDLQHPKEFTEKMEDAPTSRWTSDELFKMAALTNVDNPAPRTLEWASTLTWLVLEQGKARVGFLPPDILLYAAAALESIDRQTADSARPSTGRAAGDGWVKATQRRLDGYLERRVTLLDPQGLNSVRPVVRGDGEIELKSRVLRVSRFLRNRFEEWGVFND